MSNTNLTEEKPNIKPYEPIYTVKEAADVLKTSRACVYELIADGKLPKLVIGSIKIKGIDLERFINNLQPEDAV